MNKLIKFGKEELNINLTNDVVNKFSLYSKLIVEWNEKFNLTTILDDDGIQIKHFIDSLYPIKYISFKENDSILDIGSGAGLPAIPLAIMLPNVQFTLVESNGKKVTFLNEVKDQLGLENITILNKRVEDIYEFRGKFDYVTARAVAEQNVLMELSIPFLKVGGTLISYKGSNVDKELKNAKKAFEKLDSKLGKNIEYKLFEINDPRSLVLVKKLKPTKEKYPRPFNQISNNPL